MSQPPDLRLGTTAAGCWGAAVVVMRGSGTTGAVLAVVAGLLACLVGALTASCSGGSSARGRRVSQMGWIAVAVLLGVVIGAAATGARVTRRDSRPLAEFAERGGTAEISFVASSDPRQVTGSGRLVLIEATVTDLWLRDRRVRGLSARALVFAEGPSWREILPWQSVRAEARLRAAETGDLLAVVVFATGGEPTSVGDTSPVQRTAHRLRVGLRQACSPLPEDVGGLLPGLAIGDTTRLEATLAADFRATGMTHLCAVSGTNCAMVVGVILLLTRWCRAGPRLSAAVCLTGLVAFVILVRASPSVLRAAVMGALALVGLATGRERAAVPALAATVLLLLVVDPGLAVDWGFILSVCATAGLLILAPGWVTVLCRLRIPRPLAEAVAVPAAAQAACAPAIGAMSGVVSLTAVPVNLLAAPAVGPATVLGLCATLTYPVWDVGGRALAWLGAWPAGWLVVLARTGAGISWGELSWPSGWWGAVLLTIILVALGLAVRGRRSRVWVCTLLVAVGVGYVPTRVAFAGWPPKGWTVALCDVGQGDAAVLSVGSGQAVVVDAGPEPATVHGCLRDLGIERVPLLVVTHFHDDHIGGITGVTEHRWVGRIITPEYQGSGPGADMVRQVAEGAGIALLTRSCGDSLRVGSTMLRVLAPCEPLRATRSDDNNNSLVLLATDGRMDLMLAGDAEVEEQDWMLARGDRSRLRAGILKVPHHGSAHQSREWLAAVSPRLALVSVGAGNSWGHPSVATLRWLNELGTRILRTDMSGHIAVSQASHGGLSISKQRA